jgi:hypothetical protein
MARLLPAPCEEQPSAHADGQDGEELRQLAEVNEPCAARTDLERAHRSHAGTSTAAGAFGPGGAPPALGADWRLAAAARPAAHPASETERHFGYGNNGDVTSLDRLTVHVANAQVLLEYLRNRLERNACGRRHRSGHGDLRH